MVILQIYKKPSEERVDSPRIHKKPLFASMSIKDVPKDKAVSESGSFSKDSTVKTMNEKFGKQVCII